MRHPSETELALYAGGDLNVVRRFQVGRHIRDCARCSRETDAFASVRRELVNEASQLPAHLNWNRLSAEMSANIHVGLEAGQCVAPGMAAAPERFGWRSVALAACLSGLLVAAWTLNVPAKRMEPVMRASEVEMRTTSAGIELNENGSVLTLMHSRGGAQKPVIVSTPSSLRARFVDEETGQVTINNVYAE